MGTFQIPDLTALTVRLLTAFAMRNVVRSDELPSLILTVHNALQQAKTGVPELIAGSGLHKRKDVDRGAVASKDVIVSLINGKPYRTLKRHLGHHGMTPDQYRFRYGLPGSYSMVAPGYSELRSRIARQTGLGNTRQDPAGSS